MSAELSIIRLKELMRVFDLNQTEFARIAGLKQQNLSAILKSKRPLGEGVINKIVLELNVNKDWLLTGKGEMMKKRDNNNNYIEASLETEKKESDSVELYPSRPFVSDLQASCGVANGFTNAIMNDGHKSISLPVNTDYDFAIEVTGLSMVNNKNMELTIYPGDFAALKIITDPTYIKWGELYAIATSDDIVIKKIMPSEKEGCIKCVSYNNEDYPSYDVPTELITGWALVRAIVRVLKL